MPGEHGEDCGSKRIDIGSNVHLLAVDLLRAGIVGSAMESCGGSLCQSGTREISRQEFCEAKINELYPEIILACSRQHDVGRFDVAMHETLTMQRRERAADLEGYLECF